MDSVTSSIIDPFGRQINYLRLSVTDRCDFRCSYCMAEDMTFLPREKILTLEESAMVGQAFVELGVKKIRLTGGEPLVRHNFIWLAQALGKLEGLEELVLTTNGSQLTRYADDLVSAGVKRINISLDSLDAASFKRLTRTGDLHKVLDGIAAARNAGFERIKINAVVLKDFNEDQVLPLIEFILDNQLDISFIEEMPLGEITDHSRRLNFISSAELREQIGKAFTLVKSDLNPTGGGPSKYWHIPGFNSRIGFISPHSENFCGDCNRVRVTAEGKLLLCLGHENAVDLRQVLREQPAGQPLSTAPLKTAILDGMVNKPEKHLFSHDDTPQVVRFMNMTGG